MPTSKAQIKATNKYIGKAYDRLNIFVPKGRKATIRAFAEEQGESINSFVNGLVREKIGLSEQAWEQKPGEGGQDG